MNDFGMKCPNCQREDQASIDFCIHCGSPIQVPELEEKTSRVEGGVWNLILALVISVVPIVLLSIASTTYYDPSGGSAASMVNAFIPGFIWLAACVWGLIALVAAIITTSRGRKRTAIGIWIGLGIGIISLGWSYLAL